MNIKNIIFYIFIPIFALYFYIIFNNYQENKNYIYETAISGQIKLVQSYKIRIDDRLEYYKKLLEETSKFIIEKDAIKDYALIKQTLRILKRAGEFSEVYVGYGDINKTISNNETEFRGYDYSFTQRPWYKAVADTNQTAITAPYMDYTLNKNVISIATPIFKGASLYGVLTADLDFEILQKEIALLFPIKDGSAFLMTNNADILNATDEIFTKGISKDFLRSFGSKSSGIEKFKVADKSFIFIYNSLVNSPLVFVSLLQEDKIYEKLYQKTINDFLVSLFLILFGFGILIWISLAQKRLLKNRYLLNLFAKNQSGGVLIADKNGSIVFLNKAFENTFSLNPKKFLGKNISELSNVLGSNLSELKTRHIEFSHINLDDKTYRILATALFERGEKFEGTLISVYDITHEAQLEAQKKQQEQILIQNAKMAALGEMIGAISHQWRQPLNSLLLLISDLDDMYVKITADEILKNRIFSHLKRARTSIELMNETINIFRDFYKEDFEKKSFDIVDVLEDVLYIYRPQIEIKGIALKVDYEDKRYYINSYQAFLKQILINLLANAKDELVKISQSDVNFKGEIKVGINENEQSYIIHIEDNARGVPKDLKDKIFEPFFSTKDDGTGMGLYICKLLFKHKLKGDIYG
ncbi:ATP-binding protein [Campylobacter sp. MOP7]|uniref:ATP-binding protein n=1 Tax=Campylobacter canis TaxID=3378588 RepID=UPI00387E70D9